MAKRELKEIIDGFGEAVGIRALEDFHRRMNRFKDILESPIETALMGALIAERDHSFFDNWFFMDKRLSFDEISKFAIHNAGTGPLDGAYVWPQVKIGSYRVDFLIVGLFLGKRTFFVIECDGHEHHERTKEQAARDKSRDRWFTTNGFYVLRFSGSEIWNDPEGCVGDICDAIMEIGERQAA